MGREKDRLFTDSLPKCPQISGQDEAKAKTRSSSQVSDGSDGDPSACAAACWLGAALAGERIPLWGADNPSGIFLTAQPNTGPGCLFPIGVDIITLFK